MSSPSLFSAGAQRLGSVGFALLLAIGSVLWLPMGALAHPDHEQAGQQGYSTHHDHSHSSQRGD